MSGKFIKASGKLEFIKNMPPLKNKLINEKYKSKNSEVLNWLLGHYEIAEYIFEIVNGKDGRREKLIEYDKESGTWRGIDYKGV